MRRQETGERSAIVCTVMEEYQKDAVDRAIQETWKKQLRS